MLKRIQILLALCLFLVVLLIPKCFYASESVNSIETNDLPISVLSLADYSDFVRCFNEQVSSSNTADEIKALGFCFPNQRTIPSGNCVDDVAVTFIEEIISKFSPYIIPCQAKCFQPCGILISNIPFGIPLIIPEAKKSERRGVIGGVEEEHYAKLIESGLSVVVVRSSVFKILTFCQRSLFKEIQFDTSSFESIKCSERIYSHASLKNIKL